MVLGYSTQWVAEVKTYNAAVKHSPENFSMLVLQGQCQVSGINF